MTSNPRDVTRIKGFITYLQLVIKSVERGNYNPELVDKVNNHINDFYDLVKNNNLSLIKKKEKIKNNKVILDEKQLEENDKAYKRWKEARETNLEQSKETNSEKKTLPDDYYKSEKYQKFCEERARKYNEAVIEGKIAGEVKKIGGGLVGNQKEEVFYGERGGRYRIRYNKDGAPYRDYF